MVTTSERITSMSGGSSSGDDPSQGGTVTLSNQVTTIKHYGQGPEAGSTLQGNGSADSSSLQGNGSLSTQQEV